MAVRIDRLASEILPAPEALAPDEARRRARARLDDYSQKKKMKTSLSEMVELEDCFKEKAAVVDLFWQLGRREYKVTFEPYFGANNPTSLVERDWQSVPFHVPPGFESDKRQFRVCEWDQVIVCPKCNGHKTVACPKCRGSKQAKCGKCWGSGKVQGKHGKKNCPDCRGKGWVRCPHCGGRGIVDCPQCSGTGKIVIHHDFLDKIVAKNDQLTLHTTKISTKELLKHPGKTYFDGDVLDRNQMPGPGVHAHELNASSGQGKVIRLCQSIPEIIKPKKNDYVCRVGVRMTEFDYTRVDYKAFNKKRSFLIFEDDHIVGSFGWVGLSAGARRLIGWLLKKFTGSDKIAGATITLCTAMGWADGQIQPEERAFLEELISSSKLSKKKREKLLAQLETPPKVGAKLSDRRDRKKAMEMVAKVAMADGVLDIKEKQAYLKIGKEFGFDNEELAEIFKQAVR